MLRAGLIVGAVSIAIAVCGSLLSPFCVPCLALFAGLGAGYLAGVFDETKLPAQNDAIKVGAQAGAIAGVGAILGQVLGAVANVIIVGPQGAQDVARQLGLPSNFDANTYYAVQAVMTCCLGLLNVALMAGTGALGGVLWWQITGKSQGGTMTPPSMPA